jgi:hypothetical protein
VEVNDYRRVNSQTMDLLRALRKRDVFRPLERRLLEQLSRELAPPAADILREQISHINVVQRHSDDREVCCYPMRRGRPERDDTIAFPAAQEEQRLATIQFTVPGKGSFGAEFHLVKGHFFSIEFAPSPSQIAERTDFENLSVKLLIDPMSPTAPLRVDLRQPTNNISAPEWLTDAGIAQSFIPTAPPLSKLERDNRLIALDSQLSEEYLHIIEVADGFRVGSTVVLGLTEVYSIVVGDHSYYVLAIVGDVGVLAVRRAVSDGIWFVPYDGVAVRVESLRGAVVAGNALADL